jgi:hypothetical protein
VSSIFPFSLLRLVRDWFGTGLGVITALHGVMFLFVLLLGLGLAQPGKTCYMNGTLGPSLVKM